MRRSTGRSSSCTTRTPTGSHKVLFGTDWPVIDPERAVAEVATLDLGPSRKRMLMRDNALRVFKRL